MKLNRPAYQKYIFICNNQRAADAKRPCCGEAHGLELKKTFKALIKKHNLKMIVRAQRAGCFDLCEYGPTVAVYPDNIFYGNVQIRDVEDIFESHILNNQPVERLRLHFQKPR